MTISIFLEEKEEDLLLAVNNYFEVGLDEVGKGSIFGPVFSGVVILSKENGSKLKRFGIDDSKKLSIKKREILLPKILSLAKDWGIGQSSVREIEKYGIRHATELSMIRAIDKLQSRPSEIIIDGNLPLRIWDGIQRNIVRGESKYPSIAAASIIAKLSRDLLMNRLSDQFKVYDLSNNKGYGTKKHFSSLKKYGLTHLHRKNFLGKLKVI